MANYTFHFQGGETVAFDAHPESLREAIDKGARFLTNLDVNKNVASTVNLHNALYITKGNK